MKINKFIWIGLVTLIFGMASCSNDKNEFKYSVSEAHEFAQNVNYLSIDKVVDIILSNDTINYLFVDIRDPHDYINGHIMNAINLPLKNLHGNNIDVFCENNIIYLIYGDDGSQAALVYTYLRQLGVDNVLPIGGGYNYIYNNVISSFNIKSATYDDEIAKYNYAETVLETSGLNSTDGENSSSAPPIPIVNVQNNSVSGGGCE